MSFRLSGRTSGFMTEENFAARAKRRAYYRKLKLEREQYEITAPMDVHRTRYTSKNHANLLDEIEFETQMMIGWKRTD